MALLKMLIYGRFGVTNVVDSQTLPISHLLHFYSSVGLPASLSPHVCRHSNNVRPYSFIVTVSYVFRCPNLYDLRPEESSFKFPGLDFGHKFLITCRFP